MRIYSAKYYNSKCSAPNCTNRAIAYGSTIWWDPDFGVFHYDCAPNGVVPPGTWTKDQRRQWADVKKTTPLPGPALLTKDLIAKKLMDMGAKVDDSLPQCKFCGCHHNLQCVRCKKVLNHIEARPALEFDKTAKRHCYDCWMGNQVTQDIQKAVKTVESVNKAVEVIKEAAKPKPPEPPKVSEPKKEEEKVDRFQLIEID
jgi:hypothetical protein